MKDGDWERINITIVTFTRRDVILRQLETALGLWFQDGDMISVHTLAASARQVAHDVGEKEGKPSNLISKLTPEQRRRQFKFQNYFKHADKDPNATLHFAPEITETHLYDAILSYGKIYGGLSHLMRAFSYFYILHRPNVFPEQYPAIFEVSVSERLRKLDRREFLHVFTQELGKL